MVPCAAPNKSKGGLPITAHGIPRSLQQLLDDGIVDALVRPLESGKEADVFVVECDGITCVAKVYRSRQFRSFKNDAGYREGRTVRNTRTQRAMTKRTAFSQEIAEEAWHNAEADALRRLDAAGARVPKLIARGESVLIMEAICDAHGELAPHLGQVTLSPEAALEMYDIIIEQVILMLQIDLIHADLSPYNVLIGHDGPVIIDLPQCVSAVHNQQAARLLERDVYAIARHLGLIEPQIIEMGDAAWQIWAEYERGSLIPSFRPDPTRTRPSDVGDLAGLTEFLQTTKNEADLERRAADGDEDARALLRAAERRETRALRAAAERAAAAEEAEELALAQSSRRGSRKRSRNRRSSGAGQTEAPPGLQRDASPQKSEGSSEGRGTRRNRPLEDEPGPKKAGRRRRKRRRPKKTTRAPNDGSGTRGSSAPGSPTRAPTGSTSKPSRKRTPRQNSAPGHTGFQASK